MIENRLKKCCQTCSHVDIGIGQYMRHYADFKEPIKDVQIFCKHEPVCKMYDEETEVAIDENACSDE